jgi:hypothetical protein
LEYYYFGILECCEKKLRKFFGWWRRQKYVSARHTDTVSGSGMHEIFEKCQKTPPDSNKIEHIFLSFSITMGQSIYVQNIIVCASNSSKRLSILAQFSDVILIFVSAIGLFSENPNFFTFSNFALHNLPIYFCFVFH